jgi:hypothetical protein
MDAMAVSEPQDHDRSVRVIWTVTARFAHFRVQQEPIGLGPAVAHIRRMVIPLRDWLILQGRLRRFIPVPPA